MQFPGNCQKLDSSQQIVDFVDYHPYPTELASNMLVGGSLNKLNCVHVALQILNLDDSPRINRAWLCKDLKVANLQAMQFFYQLFHSQRSFLSTLHKVEKLYCYSKLPEGNTKNWVISVQTTMDSTQTFITLTDINSLLLSWNQAVCKSRDPVVVHQSPPPVSRAHPYSCTGNDHCSVTNSNSQNMVGYQSRAVQNGCEKHLLWRYISRAGFSIIHGIQVI